MRADVNAVVLFCGMGGACAGLAEAGIDVRLSVDGWQRACVVHRRWHPSMPVVRARCEDAHRVAPMTVDLVWASPSCKPYSTANRVAERRGTDHPEHYPLSLLVEQMQAWRARWLVIENVPGLVWSVEGKAELARFHAAVDRAGLVWNYTLLSAASCGVRQLRRRVIIVVGPRLVTIPDGFAQSLASSWALTTIMTIPRTRARMECWQRFARVAGSPHTGEVNWPGRTLDECAALQCVPMAPLEGIPRSSAHELVGNAVPPPMARVVGETLLRADAALRGAA